MRDLAVKPIARPVDATMGRRRDDLLVIGLASAAVALLHVSAAQGHWAESVLYGIGFLVLAALQFGLGVSLALTRGGGRTLLGAGIVLDLGVLLVYLASRTVGLPVGPDVGAPETLGIPDVTATLDEIVLLGLSVVLLRGRRLPDRAHLALWILAFLSLIVFTAIAHVS